MAFVGQSQMCPDGSYGSLQMALPLGNAETSVLPVLPQSCQCREVTIPSPSATNIYSPFKTFKPLLRDGKKKMVNKTWFNIHGMLHRGDKDKQITEGVHRYRMLWEPREESRNLSCVIRGGLPEEVVPDWNLKR